MAETVAPRKPKTKKIKALGIAQGVDDYLPFSAPFNPIGYGVQRAPGEETLYEVMNYDDGAPNVRQLTTMRRLDGQARAIYRIMTLPIKAALKSSTLVPAEGGE